MFVVDTDDRHRPTDFGVSKIFLNNQDGTFQLIDVGSSLNIASSSMRDVTPLWFDFDEDGDQDGHEDLYLGRWEPSALLSVRCSGDVDAVQNK